MATASTATPSETGKIAELDGVRAISIVFVLLVHISYGRVSGGFLGVDIFFVLSGYLITLLLLRENEAHGSINLQNFYARRALRILPPLVLACALGALLAKDGSLESASIFRVVTAVLLFHSNFMNAETMGNLAHTWSLSIEEQFYLVWPALLLFALRFNRVAPAVVACCMIVLCYVVRVYMVANVADLNEVYIFTFARVDSIMTGCLLAILEPSFARSRLATNGQFAAVATILALLCLVVALVHGSLYFMERTPAGFSLFAVVAATLIFTCQRVSRASALRASLRNSWIQWLGQRSYGLYLYHYPIFGALEAFRTPGDMRNYLLVSSAKIVLSLVFTELAWRLVEQPILKFKAGFPARPTGAVNLGLRSIFKSGVE
jgi:peptidoglycan/LPS O-acetylase OafA/YrhL